MYTYLASSGSLENFCNYFFFYFVLFCRLDIAPICYFLIITSTSKSKITKKN